VLTEYLRHYNTVRPHRGLDLQPPRPAARLTLVEPGTVESSVQQAILQAALEEFAAYGFHDASPNRVIEAAGISKGSMYYYFDGKEDLYAHVVHTELERLFAGLEPFRCRATPTRTASGRLLADYYLRLMAALVASPRLAGLIRGWIAAPGTPTLQRAQQDMEQAVLPWMTQALAAGQRAGAVRADLPSTLRSLSSSAWARRWTPG
jgi:AcrR family transcriptional regulator